MNPSGIGTVIAWVVEDRRGGGGLRGATSNYDGRGEVKQALSGRTEELERLVVERCVRVVTGTELEWVELEETDITTILSRASGESQPIQ